jgi:hypothetical protein
MEQAAGSISNTKFIFVKNTTVDKNIGKNRIVIHCQVFSNLEFLAVRSLTSWNVTITMSIFLTPFRNG